MKNAFSKQIEMLTTIMDGLCDSKRLLYDQYGACVYGIGGIYVIRNRVSKNIRIANCHSYLTMLGDETADVDHIIEISRTFKNEYNSYSLKIDDLTEGREYGYDETLHSMIYIIERASFVQGLKILAGQKGNRELCDGIIYDREDDEFEDDELEDNAQFDDHVYDNETIETMFDPNRENLGERDKELFGKVQEFLSKIIEVAKTECFKMDDLKDLNEEEARARLKAVIRLKEFLAEREKHGSGREYLIDKIRIEQSEFALGCGREENRQPVINSKDKSDGER